MSNADIINKQAASVEEVIDLRQYFNVINKFKWRIGLLGIAVAILAAVVTMNMTPIYSATATLLIEANQAKAVSFEEIVGLDSNQKEYYLTQFEILKSREIASSVIQQLNLKQHSDFIAKESFISKIKALLPFVPKKNTSSFTPQEIEAFKLQALIEAFSNRLTITPIRKTQLVNVSYESADSKLAAQVANAVGEIYITQNLSAQMGLTQKATGWLTTQMSDLKVRLKESEEKLQLYREEENLVDVEGVLGLISRELEQTSQQLVVARNDMNKLQSIVRVINEYGRDNIQMLESMTEITSHKVIQDIKTVLVQSELKVSELAEVYGPKHPKMISARSELETVRLNFSTQIRALVVGVEKELKTNERNVLALERELKRIRADYQKVTRKSNEYRQLSRDVETNRKIYDTFLSRSKETEITSDFNSAVARFTDRAFRPSSPVKPKKSLIVILAFIATIGLGVVAAFIEESLNDTIKSGGDIENKLSQRMLGLLPLIPLKKDNNLLPHFFFKEEGKQFSEAVRTIRTSFVLTQLEKKSQVIEVTSTLPGEGKTTVAINLAFSLGQLHKTIIIDADMRKPSIGKRFDIPAYRPGLANLIAGSVQFKDCIFADKRSKVSVMPCGQIPSNPLELLSSTKFDKLITILKEKYEYIIIDTAPINAVSDSLVIAQKADTVVYVVKSDDTRIGIIKNSLGRLLDMNAKIAGVVMNHFDTKKLAKDDYYQGYYDSYSYSSHQEVEKGDLAELTISSKKPV